MATDSALKLKVTTDVSEVKKGLKQVSDDVKSFDRTSSGALQSLAGAFGVNVSKIQEMSSAFSGAAAKMAQSAGVTKDAVMGISSAMGGIGLAAGAVVATVVAAWKQMDTYAQHYLGTLEGIATAEASQAYKDTYKNYVADMLDGGAQNAANVNAANEGWMKTWQAAKIFFQAGTGALGEKSVGQVLREANEAGEKARAIQTDITNAQMRQLDLQPRLREIQAQINEDMAVFRGTSADAATRRAALARIEENIGLKYELQRGDLKIIADGIREINGLSSTSVADKEKEVKAQNALVDLTVNEKAERAALVRYSNSLNRSLGTSVGTAKELLEVTEEIGSSLGLGDIAVFNAGNFAELEQYAGDMVDAIGRAFIMDGKLIDTTELANNIEVALDDAATEINLGDYEIEVPVTPVISGEDLKGAITDFVTNIAAGLGEALGGALSGESGAWANFGAEIISSLGDFATRLGTLLISFGTAGMALKNFIKNPELAIAAGLGLVALGAGVNAAARNLASGTYAGATTYSGSGSYAASGSNYTERDLNIKVSGTLTGSGSALLGVIENETNRKNKTT